MMQGSLCEHAQAISNMVRYRRAIDTTQGDEQDRQRKTFAGYIFAFSGSFVGLLATTRSLSVGNHICFKALFMLLMLACYICGGGLLWQSEASTAVGTRTETWRVAEKTSATVILALAAGLCDARYLAVATTGAFGVAGLFVLADVFELRSRLNVRAVSDDEFNRVSGGGALCWLACLFAMAVASIVWAEPEVSVVQSYFILP